MPKTEAQGTDIHGMSSRDRKFVSVEIVWLGQSPGHRRLRFSFQFNDVKDPDWLSPAPLFSAGGRRRRLSSGRPLSCQSVLSDFFATALDTRNLAAKIAAGRRGASLIVSVAIRLRLGKIPSSKLKSKWLVGRLPFASSLAPVPSGRRLSSGRPDARQLILSDFLAVRRINRVLTKKNRFRSAGAASRPGKWSAVSVEAWRLSFSLRFSEV